uniref:hypothetical protein n=1 Tax=Yersinia alsatica TaxID=2890317 RepID=UPI001C94951D
VIYCADFSIAFAQKSEFIYQLYDSIWLIIFLIEIQKISKILIYIGYILQSKMNLLTTKVIYGRLNAAERVITLFMGITVSGHR